MKFQKSLMYKVLMGFLFLAIATASFENWCYGAEKESVHQVAKATFKNAYDLGYTHGSNTLTLVEKEFEDLTFKHVDFKANSEKISDSELTDIRLGKIMEKSNPKLSEEQKKQYKKYIVKWANEYDLSPIFVASIIHRESNFREKLISNTGCKGPMQVSASSHKDKLKKLGIKPNDLYNINHGVNVGCQVIKEYLDKSKGNYRKALFRYLGSGNTKFANRYVNDIFNMSNYALKFGLNGEKKI